MFLLIAILIRVRWYSTMVFIYISPMISDIEHCLRYLLAVCLFKRSVSLGHLSILKSDYLFNAVELFEFFIGSGCWSWQVNSLTTFSQVPPVVFSCIFSFCAAVSTMGHLQQALYHVVQVHTHATWKVPSPLCLYKRLWIHLELLPDSYEQKHTFKRWAARRRLTGFGLVIGPPYLSTAGTKGTRHCTRLEYWFSKTWFLTLIPDGSNHRYKDQCVIFLGRGTE